MKLSLRRIAEFISADSSTLGIDADLVPTGYSIDSRTIQPGEVFFAVKGEHLDGHDYLDGAFQRGAIAAVVSKQRLPELAKEHRLLAAADTLVALQTLAAAVRRLWGKPLIAVTEIGRAHV